MLPKIDCSSVLRFTPNVAQDSINLFGQLLVVGANNIILPDTSAIIPVFSCDQSAWPSFELLCNTVATFADSSPTAIVFYSSGSLACSFNGSAACSPNPIFKRFYTMTNPRDGPGMVARGVDGAYVTLVRKNAFDQGNSSSATTGGDTSQGPSPSTAVAMIILYSITGVITALFLVIIVTGAVRAHRHPERYGPRAGQGRPHQSRARGLARAMLETIPIVKFGEREEDKPPDVEMSGANPRPVSQAQSTDVAAKDVDADTIQTVDASNADAGATSMAISPEPPPAETEAPGCSICTEDFERGQDVRVLPCNHSFHPACVDPWLLNVSGTCPLWYVFDIVSTTQTNTASRIDLRPTTSNSATADVPATTASGSSIQLPPPLEGDDPAPAAARRSSRRHSIPIWDLLNPRAMREATEQERLQALRLVREEQRARTSPAEEAEARRRRRLTARLHDVFRIHTTTTRRGRSPPAETPSPTGREAETATVSAMTVSTGGGSLSAAAAAASSVETIPEAAPGAEAEAAGEVAAEDHAAAAVALAADDAQPADNPAPERFAAGR